MRATRQRSYSRRSGQIKPFWYRLLTSGLLGAAGGALLGLLFPGMHLALLGAIIGLLTGLVALEVRKILFGLLLGAGLGWLPWPNGWVTRT